MRVAVIGKGGQLAHSLAERAADRGVLLYTLGRPNLDLLRPDCVEPTLAALQPDAVINAAAYTAVDLAESECSVAHALNCTGAEAIARAARRLRIPMVHVSTDYVFDGTLKRPYHEDDETAPLNVYGKTKLEGERAVAVACRNHSILRTSWVYSPFRENFVKKMLDLAGKRKVISVVSDQIGSPTSALDLADAALHVAQRLAEQPNDIRLRGIFHATGSGATSWAEFAATIFAHSRELGGPAAEVQPILTSEYPTVALRPANSQLCNRRFSSIFGLRLPLWKVSLLSCVERILREQGLARR